MPRPIMQETAPRAILPDAARRSYVVMRRQNLWFIAFEGKEFGPYQSERQAMLFAVDAAHRLGTQGQETQVLKFDETGNARPVWSCGLDPYPPVPS